MIETLRTFELNILNAIQNIARADWLDAVMVLLSYIGELGLVWIVIAVVLMFNKKYRLFGILMCVGMLVGVLIGNVALKNIFDRLRPFTYNPEIALLIAPPGDPSFPSGHTLSSFISATVLAYTGKKRFAVPAFVLAGMMAFSRMYLYVHFPSDVLCGIVLGIGIGTAVYFVAIKAFKDSKLVKDTLVDKLSGDNVNEVQFNIPKTDLFEEGSGFKGGIFDLDGTLLDSVGMWAKIDHDFLGKRGFEVPDDYIISIGHLKFHEIAEYTIERFGLTETPEEVIAEWREMARTEYKENVVLKPGAREYLLALKARGIKLAVATALEQELYEIALKRNEIYDLFDAFTNIYEINGQKGTPDVYVKAAEKMGLTVDECVVFEDIIIGAKGAKAAESEMPGRDGFTVVGVYNKESRKNAPQLLEICDYFIHDFKDLINRPTNQQPSRQQS